MGNEERRSESTASGADVADRYQPAVNYVKLDRAHRKRSHWSAILAVSLVTLAISLVLLGIIGFSYLQGQAKNARIAEGAGFAPADVEAAFSAAPGELEIEIDWDALLAVNPDTVGWLYIPGTAVNYPVVQGDDNEYYLSHDFNGDQGWLAQFGAIFLDWRNNPDWSDQAYFIYGHHMNDGSMFADIAGLADQGRFDASRTVYLLSPRGNFKLRSFSLIHCASDDPLVQTAFTTDQDMAAYVQDKINRSIVSVGSIPPAADIVKCFAFATCDNYSAGRYVLYAYVEAEAEGSASTVDAVVRGGGIARAVDDVPYVDASGAPRNDADRRQGGQEPDTAADAAAPGDESAQPEGEPGDGEAGGGEAAPVGDYGEYAGGHYTYDEDGELRWVPDGEE